MPDKYDRLNRYVDDLLADRSPRPFAAEDLDEREILEMAARLRLLKPGVDQPRPRFLASIYRRMAKVLQRPTGVSRRKFVLGSAGGLVAGVVAGVGLAAAAGRALLGGRLEVPSRTPLPGGWHAVAKLDDVPLGGALSFTIMSSTGYLMRNGDQVSALLAKCNHKGCPVDWNVDTKDFVCRCDDVRFDRAGMYVSSMDSYAAPVRPLTRMAVRVLGDTVFVRAV